MDEREIPNRSRRSIRAILSAYFAELRRDLRWKDLAAALVWTCIVCVAAPCVLGLGLALFELVTGMRLPD